MSQDPSKTATSTGGATESTLSTLLSILSDVWNSTSHFLSVSLSSLLAGENQTGQGLATFRKFLSTSDYTVSRDISAALEASSIAKAAAGNILGTEGRIDSTAPTGTYYIQWMDSATLPANGAVTMLRAPMKIQHVSGMDDYFSWFTDTINGVPATAGIVVDISTTEFTKTISGAYLSMTNYVI